MSLLNELLEKNIFPDWMIRFKIRQLLKMRLSSESSPNEEAAQEKMESYVQLLKKSPLAVQTEEANEQHYEVPTVFYQKVLGKNLKYSSGYWNETCQSLDESEEKMLDITCQRAELSQGQEILELGCGWGSLALWMAKKYPLSHITAVSNSKTQKTFIDSEIKKRGLSNIEVMTANMLSFEIHKKFDRVVSVEMFEHMRNYQALLKKISEFLNPDGKLFVHIFTHRDFAYLFEDQNASDWMARYFFSGGQMPSDHLLYYFSEHLIVDKHWRIDGTHYQKTSEAWLKNMDIHKDQILKIFQDTYGQEPIKWWVYWRIFFMSCAELWGFNKGREWFVSHYLMKRRLCEK